MRSKLLIVFAVLLALMLFISGCGGNSATCPTCGTTVNGAYGVIDIIPVPEHNPTGEPGGPFNSFDISLADPIHHRFYVSDRIGLDVVAVDTQLNLAVNFFTGANGVAGGGFNASSCVSIANGDGPPLIIPPIVSGLGNWVRFGCRTPSIPTPFHIPGFGPNGLFGGFPGAQCCAARANGVNPLSAPDGEAITADGKILFIGNGSASVVAFDLTPTFGQNIATNPLAIPNVIAAFPTGVSPDYDGFVPASGIQPCIASANGRAFSDATCGDLRADEMSLGVPTSGRYAGHTLLLVANGDPGLPFVTVVDVTHIVSPLGTVASFGDDHCLPPVIPGTTNDQAPYGPPLDPSNAVPPPSPNTNTKVATGPVNPGRCILGQIYYDGAAANNRGVSIDDVGLNAGAFFCPDPTTPALSGVSGHGTTGTGGAAGTVVGPDIPCHHAPQLITATSAALPTTLKPLPADQTAYCSVQDGSAPPGTCFGAVAIAGIGGSAFNPKTNRFLVTNASASATDLTYGTVDEIDPQGANGPVVVNSLRTLNCMPTSIIQGPGSQFLVGCGDHDGEAFPPNEYVLDCSANCKILTQFTVDKVGGVDEIWYNPGDNRYYLAARDMPGGPVMGVIDATTNQWLVNVTTNSNSHSIAVDSNTNHVFVPLQSGGICGTQSSNGCIGVFAQQ